MPKMGSRTIEGFLGELASASATPGGGSVAALTGAIASDLGCMVCRLTLKKTPRDELEQLLVHFSSLEGAFLELADADEAAFSEVMNAYRLDRNDGRRPAMIASAFLGATAVPQRVAEKGIDLLEHLCALTPLGSKQSVSDVGVAVHLAQATVRSALLNIRINLAYMRDEAEIERINMIAEALDKKCSALSEQAISSVTGRISR
ncbi:MAG TPA: formiminotransferase-cyclodeaminase [Candidatus Acetothermia bacterium]|nr:formiminotransferase-cyclodeaminase [Candidatus Acetothermia bacterium]